MSSPFDDAKMSAAVSKDIMNRDIITGTLDALNSSTYSGKSKGKDSSSAMSESYDFQKSVLDAAYNDKGATLITKG